MKLRAISARRRRLLILALLIVAALATGYAYTQSQGKPTEAGQTAVARIGDLEIVASASGTVEADVQVEVKSRASGEVIEVPVDAGDTVLAGDLLIRLDPTDEERRVSQAEAELRSARAALGRAKASLASARADALDAASRAERRANAFKAGLVSAEELSAAKAAAEIAEQSIAQREGDIIAAQANLEQAELALAETKKRLRETTIRAPVPGTVLSVKAERGAIVSSGITNVGGGTALLTLADLSKLFVIVKLDEAQIGSVKIGQSAKIRVDAYPEKSFRGEVERVTPLGVTEANIVTFDVKIAVTDPAARRLLPGMSADVEIETARHEKVLLIPVAAVRSAAREKKNGAPEDRAARAPRFVLLAGGERRDVSTGATDGQNVVIREGLQEGDVVIVAGAAGSSSTQGAPGMGRGMMMMPRR